MSSIQAEVGDQVAQVPLGKVFSYDSMPAYREAPNAVVKAVSRLVRKGELRRFAKGQFYRPRQGVLGEVPLKDTEKLKPLLYKGGRRVAYITGVSLYNRLGLTSQVPRVLTLARKGAGKGRNMGTFSVRIVPARAPVKDEDIPVLELLDVLKDIRRIPDTTPDETLCWLLARTRRLTDQDRHRMVGLADEFYPPMVRALLGMLLETLGKNEYRDLESSLNPVSRYKVFIDHEKWALARKWHIL